MTTQPTQNPVPSESARDLKFNAGKIDEFVTSLALKYQDRFGAEHYTIEGIRQLAQEAIAAFGWITVDSFQDGATLTLPNEILRWKLPDGDGEYYRWDGILPKEVPAGSTPENSGGIGPGAWLSVGDATLRKMLAEGDGSLIGYQFNSNAMHQTIKERFDAEPIYLSSYCKPSKSVDNSEKIQQAINDALSMHKPLIVDGVFYSSTQLTVVLPPTLDNTFSFVMRGYGRSSSMIKFPAGVNGIVLTSATSQYSDIVYGAKLNGFSVQCDTYDIVTAPVPNDTNFTVGIYHAVGLGQSEFEDLGSKGFDYGFRGENTLFLSRIIGCHQLQCYNGLYMSNRGTSNQIDQNYVYGSRGTAYRLTGIYSSLGSLACDRSEGDIYIFSYFGGSIGSLGYESYAKGTVGTIFRAGSSDITIGELYMQDLQGKVTSASKLIDASGSRVTVENWVILDSNSASTPSDGLLGTGITNYNSRIRIGTYNAPYKVRTGNPAWDSSVATAYTEINGARFANAWGRAYLGTLTSDVSKVTSGSTVVEPCIQWDFYGSPRYAGPTGNVNMSYGPVLKLGQWGVESRPDLHGVAGFVATNNSTDNISLQYAIIPAIHRQTTRPSNPVVGAIWINPSTNKICHFAGTNWYDATGTIVP